jgi:short-subunit dehydrogenase
MDVRNKNIIVTGGGNGLGRSMVLTLLSRGARVFAVDISKDGLYKTLKISRNNPRLSLHIVDITDKDSVNSLAEKIISKYKHVDGIINNAGIIQPFIHLKDLDLEPINRVLNVNFYGTLYMTKAFLPHLIKRPKAHIINISSMGGFFPFPGQSIYGASKAAVKLMTEGLYSELMHTNVNVTIVFPGGIATDIMKNSNIETNKENNDNKNSKFLITPKKAAKIIIDAVEQDKFRVFVGKDSKVMNLLYTIHPKLAIKVINKLMSSKIY